MGKPYATLCGAAEENLAKGFVQLALLLHAALLRRSFVGFRRGYTRSKVLQVYVSLNDTSV